MSSTIDEQIIDLAADCAADPLRWSEVAYDWGEGELAKNDGPRKWQSEAFAQIRDHLKDPTTLLSAYEISQGVRPRHRQVGVYRHDNELGAFDLR